MVSSRKRTIQETDDHLEEPTLLHRIRNQWQFANLCQWIYLFGKVVKIDDSLDTEDIETECLKPNAPVLQDIGLALLKFISSHRGLTHELFDEYTRRQYTARAPEKNPFGAEEVAAKFADFDVSKKIRILQQLTQWVMVRPERVREKMEEQKDVDQATWRIEPIGWDRDDRTYFVLDDNRVYRLTDAPPKPVTPRKRSNKAKYGSRSNKRRRVSAANVTDNLDQSANDPEESTPSAPEEDGLGGMKWECLAVTLEEVQVLIASFLKTKDDNEKVLRDSLQEHLLPILEKQEESRKRKEQQREKELLNLAKMANAKRSSRIAGKVELQKQEEKAKSEAQVLHAQQVAARKEEQQRLRLERERDSRLLSRENRLKDREARRSQHERELSQLSEDNRSTSGRASERRLQAEIEKNKRALRELDDEDEEDDWIFDCICGVYGQVDDGTHSIACEKCNVWQHSKCVGISETEAERPEFHFVCQTCRRREEEAAVRPRTTIKLKVNRTGGSSSPPNNHLLKASSSETFSSKLTVGISVLPRPAEEPVDAGNTEAQQAGQADVQAAEHGTIPQDGGCATNGTQAVSAAGPSGPSNPASGTPSAKGASPEPTTPKADEKSRGRAALFSNMESLPDGIDEISASPMRSGATPGPLDASSPRPGGSSLMATPIISREHGVPGSAHSSFTLPSAEAGLSPTKNSPPLPRPQPPSVKTPALPAILPPIATLSPSPRQQILTPPIKSTEPARRSQQPGANTGAL
ncbi:PHD-finger domain-containing protein [Colletotrichum karsti]|uniref:PHD-finger domain-containing protein n=1 Tax=Colletotrichum karsti TaxID=1095194 RepID=A0A9P6HSB8_9PEZI|nr:PHD-finger domain-containing protein [Colletotrichum karsti]KAF9869813.1 PHD-finger domain-containing protein [Colletotrichum karsti]